MGRPEVLDLLNGHKAVDFRNESRFNSGREKGRDFLIVRHDQVLHAITDRPDDILVAKDASDHRAKVVRYLFRL